MHSITHEEKVASDEPKEEEETELAQSQWRIQDRELDEVALVSKKK